MNQLTGTVASCNGQQHLRRRALRRPTYIALSAATLLLWHQAALADLTDLLGQFSNEIEEQSAIATQAVYDQLRAAGCNDLQAGPTTNCGGSTFLVWRNVREVVHNANALSGETNGPTGFSLGRDRIALLGRALQWCNGEEFTAMGSLATSFTGAQTTSLATRITALRFGANGLRLASADFQNGMHRGGGASSDEVVSTWSGFINGDYTAGDREITQRENAFDFRSRNFTAGIDKRLNDRWVIGVVAGYQHQNLNFVDVIPGSNALGPIDVVNAGTRTSGASLLPFVLYQTDTWFFNASIGYQQLEFNSNRRVIYAPGPLAVSALNHNTEADGDTRSRSWSSYETVGYSWRPAAALSIEPSMSVDYRHINIDAFRERDLQNDGFDFIIDKQTIESLEVIPELRIQYTFTPGFGVWTPYVDAQWHRQLKDEPRVIHALYAGAASSLNSDAQFAIETDAPDDSYQVYTAGLSAVLSGSQRGGVQVYANYRWYQQLEHFSLHSVSAGFRYEF